MHPDNRTAQNQSTSSVHVLQYIHRAQWNTVGRWTQLRVKMMKKCTAFAIISASGVYKITQNDQIHILYI